MANTDIYESVNNQKNAINHQIILNIKDLMAKNNIKAAELARRINMPKGTMSKLLNEQRKFQLKEAEKFAQALHATADDILKVDTTPEPKKDNLTPNQRLVAYSIDPDISDEEREAIIEMVQAAKKFRKRL